MALALNIFPSWAENSALGMRSFAYSEHGLPANPFVAGGAASLHSVM